MKFQFPKWWRDWNKANPTNLFGPAILVGTLGVALFAAVMVILWASAFRQPRCRPGRKGRGCMWPSSTWRG